MTRLFRLLCAGTVALSATFFAAVPSLPAGAGAAGPYTSVQALSGARDFAKSCAACHGAQLQGTSAPALKGKTSGIAQQSIAQVYAYISQQMPLTKPGGLSAQQYLGIMSFILKQNGHAPGKKALTVASARADMGLLNP